MSRVVLPPPLVISEQQKEVFASAISRTLNALELDDLKRVYLFHDKSVVVSYSGDYQPFLGYTMSYNHPDERVYINQYSFVLEKIGEALDFQGRDIPGGRVFIEKEYVYVKDFGFNHKVILLLDWRGYDVYNGVVGAYVSALVDKRIE